MGLLFADLRSLLDMHRSRESRVVTLGRLNIYLHPSEVRTLRAMFPKSDAIRTWCDDYRSGQSADSFFVAAFGARSVSSIDFSAFEGATIVHDLGTRIPNAHHGQYDCVVDGGTLEHVFNIPVALENIMLLAAPGGTVHIHGPANNQCGHGFYQFSPELMFRVFSPENGFRPKVRLCIARHFGVELSGNHKVYEVTDPAVIGQRVTLISRRPVLIMLTAIKERELPGPIGPVLQSDYASLWARHGEALPDRLRPLKAMVRRHCPGLTLRLQGLLQRWRASLWNTRSYRRVW